MQWKHSHHYQGDLHLIIRGDTPENNLEKVWAKVVDYYRRTKSRSRYGILRMTMFKNGPGGYPKLKGKAAEVKHLTPALLEIWAEAMKRDDTVHIAVHTCLKASVRLDQILEEHTDFTLPEEVANEFVHNAFLYVQHNSLLANAHKLPLFNVTVKLHYMLHGARNAKFLNPRMSWCFQGEDYMQHMRVLAHSCLRGNPMHQAQSKLLDKMLIAMHASFTGLAKPV